MLGSVPEKAGQNETAGVVIPLDTEGRRDLGRRQELSARGRGERRDPAHPVGLALGVREEEGAAENRGILEVRKKIHINKQRKV